MVWDLLAIRSASRTVQSNSKVRTRMGRDSTAYGYFYMVEDEVFSQRCIGVRTVAIGSLYSDYWSSYCGNGQDVR